MCYLCFVIVRCWSFVTVSEEPSAEPGGRTRPGSRLVRSASSALSTEGPRARAGRLGVQLQARRRRGARRVSVARTPRKPRDGRRPAAPPRRPAWRWRLGVSSGGRRARRAYRSTGGAAGAAGCGTRRARVERAGAGPGDGRGRAPRATSHEHRPPRTRNRSPEPPRRDAGMARNKNPNYPIETSAERRSPRADRTM